MTDHCYRFWLVCPRCGKESETVSDDRHTPPPVVNCGDCLMDDVEVVEMKVVQVDVIDAVVLAAMQRE
jgi:hypothetical protein